MCKRDCDGIDGLFFCQEDPFYQKTSCFDYQFQCKDRTCISDISVCDGVRDCSEGEDEAECGCQAITFSPHWMGQDHYGMCKKLSANIQAKCHEMSFVCPLEKCIPMTYVCDGIRHCKLGNDEFCETNTPGGTNTDLFECASGEEVNTKYVNDLIPDCKNGKDEVEYKPYYQPEILHPADKLTCDSGKNVSFSLHHMCQFDLDGNGILKYCRNGAHLENCETYNCSDTFKCPQSYCIPYRMLCNGVADCIDMVDEQACDSYICPGMLHCKGQRYCVSRYEVCDGVLHCQHGDDEINCAICPVTCHCLNHALYCEQGSIGNILQSDISYMKLITFKNCSMGTIKTLTLNILLEHFQNSLFVFMNHVDLKHICTEHGKNSKVTEIQSSIILLNISFNVLEKITSGCFTLFKTMRTLSLSKNKIIEMSPKSFDHGDALLFIDLSHNRLTSLSGSIWSTTPNLLKLDLSGNSLVHFSGVITSPRLSVLLTESYFVCCFTVSRHINCSAGPVLLSSCNDLLHSIPVKAVAWTVGLFSFVATTFNAIIRLLPMYEKKPIDFNIIEISMGDALFGTYLLVLAVADCLFMGRFSGVQFYWQQSGWCKLAAGLYLYSAMSSVTGLVTLSFLRIVAVTRPVYAKLSLFSKVKIVLFLKGIVLILVMTTLVSGYFYAHEKAPNFVCLLVSFGEKNHYLTVLTILLSVFEILGLFFILFSYAIMSYIIIDTQQQLREGKFASFKTVNRDVKIVIASNILCWIPSSTIFLITLAGHKLPSILRKAVKIW